MTFVLSFFICSKFKFFVVVVVVIGRVDVGQNSRLVRVCQTDFVIPDEADDNRIVQLVFLISTRRLAMMDWSGRSI